MKFTRFGTVAALAAAGALVLTSCAANEGSSSGGSDGGSGFSGTLTGAGSSAQASAQEAWVAAFQTANPDVTVNYDSVGSGAGRETFISGGTAFAGSDSALSEEELAGTFGACADGASAIDLPIYISPIAVVFNVDGVDSLSLDAATIAGIFKGDITSWDDPAIAALNADATLPSAPITAVHRSDDSGTTKNFTDYLNKNAPEVWDAPAADPFPYKGGEAAQGTTGVIDAVTNGNNAIGYADASKAGSLGVAAIKVGDTFIDYTPEAASAIVDASPLVDDREPNDLAVKLDRTSTAAGTYPIVLVSYIIACQEYPDTETADLVKAYLTYVASEEGQAAAADAAGSAPISSDLAAKVQTAIDSIS